jgi:hypothetical protein
MMVLGQNTTKYPWVIGGSPLLDVFHLPEIMPIIAKCPMQFKKYGFGSNCLVIRGSPVGETHQPETMPIDVECLVLFKKDGLRSQYTSHQPKLSRN